MGTTEKKDTENQFSFEEAVERLETILQSMEEEQLPLEQLLQRYEEGVKLLRFCQEQLKAAHDRIRVLMEEANGSLNTASMDTLDFQTSEES